MLDLFLTDSSLYCAQWDYQNKKPLLFSFLKVKLLSPLSTIWSDPDEVKHVLKTALSQLNNVNKIQGTSAHVIIDHNLSQNDSIDTGDISKNNEIEDFLQWTLKNRWGKQINNLSFALVKGNPYYYFAIARTILAEMNRILNEYGCLHISVFLLKLYLELMKFKMEYYLVRIVVMNYIVLLRMGLNLQK